jgi:serine-type D-Ala-D-Ala carboxypeptidase/endopeptidase (penicillin-binding protein 4)
LQLTSSIHFLLFVLLLSSCSVNKQLAKSANKALFADSAMAKAHIGISVFDASTNKFLYQHNASNYFVPASNIKILSCYVAMKFLGDSIPGIQYVQQNNGVLLLPTGDPTLLHPDFTNQPVIRFLQKVQGPISINNDSWKTDALGAGWSWGDYNFVYSTERSALPVYGNVIQWIQETTVSEDTTQPNSPSTFSIPEVEWKVRFNSDLQRKNFYVQRNQAENVFTITEGSEKRAEQSVPFVTNGIQSALELLKDTVGKNISITDKKPAPEQTINTIYSVKLDSVLKPMMHRSDNFFAEQLLLMVANKRFGVFSEDRIIDSLLTNELKDLPQQPSWADGSGLSRYNLFSPDDFVVLLNKMQKEFGLARLKDIFPTGGEGTIANYYKQDSGFVYAKTGSLNGVFALSGFMTSKKGKLILFSTLINNYRGSATTARRKIEQFISKVRLDY